MENWEQAEIMEIFKMKKSRQFRILILNVFPIFLVSCANVINS